jgi:hypothetical protein
MALMNNQVRRSGITRGQLGQLGSLLTWFGLMLGILGIIWQGGFTPIILILFAIGVLGMIIWGYFTPEDFGAFFRGQRVQRGTMAIFGTFLLIAVVSITYIIVQRSVLISDVTLDRRFTLSAQSREIIEGIKQADRKVFIIGLYRPQDLVQREIDDQYWQLYENTSGGLIQRLYIDPIQNPAQASPFQSLVAQNYYVFVAFEAADGGIDYFSVQAVNNSPEQERNMSEALARLFTLGDFNVYFETSLGTADVNESTQLGLSIFNNSLVGSGILTDFVSLESLAVTNGFMPIDADALIIVRPQRQPTTQEFFVLDEYLQRGGRLFIAADFDPSLEGFMSEGSELNEYMWANYGIKMTNKVIVDTQSPGPSPLDAFTASIVSGNEITEGINIENDPTSGAIFHLARALEVNPDPPVQNGTLITSSEFSWGEADIESLAARNEFTADPNVDTRGPLPILAYANSSVNNSRVVLIGDSDFIQNGYASSNNRGNLILGLNSIGWLTGFSETIAFDPVSYLATPLLFAGGQQLDIIVFITIVLMPGAMLMAAILIYIRRYSA